MMTTQYCAVCALEGKRVPLNKKGACPFQAAERKEYLDIKRMAKKGGDA